MDNFLIAKLLIGIYLIIGTLVVSWFWAALIAAKRADHIHDNRGDVDCSDLKVSGQP